MLSKFHSAASVAAVNHSRRLTAALRREAWESGWPASAARNLWVKHEDGEYQVFYPGHAKDHIESFEYGGHDSVPNPAIRSFMNRLDQHSHHVDAELLPHVMNMAVLD